MKKTNTCICGKALASLELDDPNPGRQKWWRAMRTIMVLRKDSGLVLKPDIARGIGGFATSCDGCHFVAMRPSLIKAGKIKFRKERDFAIFVHEMGHFWSFYWLRGKLGADTYAKDTVVPDVEQDNGQFYSTTEGRFLIELEAWHLSRQFNERYDMGLLEAIDDANKTNMFNVCVMTGLLSKDSNKRRKTIMKNNDYENWRLDKDTKRLVGNFAG